MTVFLYIIPVPIHSERIDIGSILEQQVVVRISEIRWIGPHSWKILKGNRHKIVVDKAAVEREEAHQDKCVTGSECVLHYFAHLSLFVVLEERERRLHI